MTCHTSGPAPAARTRISTSCSPATGSSTSRNSSTSASPYRSCTIAFIAIPLTVTVYAVHPQPTLGCTTYTCQARDGESRKLRARARSGDGDEDPGDRAGARTADEGAHPWRRGRPCRRGRGRGAQHAQARPGARRRPDGALQTRGQQGRAPRRDDRCGRGRDRPPDRGGGLEGDDASAHPLGSPLAPSPSMGLERARVPWRADAEGDRLHRFDDGPVPGRRLLDRPDAPRHARDGQPDPRLLAGAVRRHLEHARGGGGRGVDADGRRLPEHREAHPRGDRHTRRTGRRRRVRRSVRVRVRARSRAGRPRTPARARIEREGLTPMVMEKPKSVAAYFRKLPPAQREPLQKLRDTIAAAAPEAEEGITYSMPGFLLGGKGFVAYAAFKDHYSFFPMGTSAIEDYKDQLGDHLTGKGTISFRYGERLPVTVVKKIVRERLAEANARRTLRR